MHCPRDWARGIPAALICCKSSCFRAMSWAPSSFMSRSVSRACAKMPSPRFSSSRTWCLICSDRTLTFASVEFVFRAAVHKLGDENFGPVMLDMRFVEHFLFLDLALQGGIEQLFLDRGVDDQFLADLFGDPVLPVALLALS